VSPRKGWWSGCGGERFVLILQLLDDTLFAVNVISWSFIDRLVKITALFFDIEIFDLNQGVLRGYLVIGRNGHIPNAYKTVVVEERNLNRSFPRT
jgi:hypothetical protein